MSSTMERTQRILLLALPLVFLFFILNFPAGLVLYWVTTNLWTTGQGIITRRLLPKGPAPPAPKRCSRTPAKEEPEPQPAARQPEREGDRSGGGAGGAEGQAEEEEGTAVSDDGRAPRRGDRGDGRRGEVGGAARARGAAAPGWTRRSVSFQVVSEGERGILGVGYAPARVVATAVAGPEPEPDEDESEAAALLREVVERDHGRARGRAAASTIEEDEESLRATVAGHELGVLIGRHGQTIDAIQYLASAVIFRSGARKNVVVDAAGYRSRRPSDARDARAPGGQAGGRERRARGARADERSRSGGSCTRR